jgi:protein-S-isoprenylcysteine O-methyltransferase Ste14
VRKASTTRGSSRWREFRRRGGVWTIAQFALMAVIAGAWLLPPRWPDTVAGPLKAVGVALAVLGTSLAAASYLALGRSMTPLPEPKAGAELVAQGPYRYARHPMYGGGLLLFGGVSLVTSIPSLILTAALAVLWWRKSMLEEHRLAARYPDYDAYRGRTPRRFLPFIA